MKNLRYKLIKLLAAGESILMNWNVNGLLVKEGHSVVYIPKKDDSFTRKELFDKAVLTPRNPHCTLKRDNNHDTE